MPRFVLSLLVVSCFSVLACSGYSDDEAKTKCDLERQANSSCFTDATYKQCLSCYENCGQDCSVAESCPAQYLCAE